jgi:AhpD family alkylhydroperoxidase
VNIDSFNEKRTQLNDLMQQEDDFFGQFGSLDTVVYAEGVIPKKYKELTGLAISVCARCDECILYHIQGSLKENASKEECIEAIKIGVVGGGSVTYPSARYAFRLLQEFGLL